MKPVFAIITFLCLSVFSGDALATAFGLDTASTIGAIAGSGLILGFTGVFNGVLPVTLASLSGPSGTSQNIGGTKSIMYYAETSDFTTIQEPVNYGSITTFASAVAVSTAHVFATGGCFYSIYCTRDKGSVKCEKQGEEDGISFKYTGKVFYPGSEQDFLGFIRIVTAKKFVTLHPTGNGTVHQIGTTQFPASLSGSYDSGEGATALAGGEIMAEATALGPINYTGTISLTPAP